MGRTVKRRREEVEGRKGQKGRKGPKTGFQRQAGCLSYESPSGHFGPGFFENGAFAFGEALDAVSGDLVENGVHFFAEEFSRGQFFVRLVFGSAPKARFLRRDFDQAPHRPRPGPAELRPLEMPMNGVTDKNEASDHA